VDSGITPILEHPDSIAERRTTGQRAGRIDSQRRDCPPTSPELPDERVDQGALTGAGRSGRPDDPRPPGPAEDRLLGAPAEFGPVLGMAQQPGERPAVTGQKALNQVAHIISSRTGACWRMNSTAS